MKFIINCIKRTFTVTYYSVLLGLKNIFMELWWVNRQISWKKKFLKINNQL